MKRIASVAWVLVAATAFLIAPGCSEDTSKTRQLQRGNQYFDAADSEKARIEYLNVIKLEPTNHVAISRLAQIYYDRGELNTALPLLVRARELSPENLEVRRRLGQVLLQGGKLEEARAEAEAILDLNPADEDGILILSRAARDTNELAQVRTRLEELRTRTGDNAALQLAFGNLAMRTGDRATAETSFKQALALEPQSGRAKLALGSLYWTQGKTNEAGALFQEAAREAKPTSPEGIRWVQYKLQTGDREEAKRILEGAAKSEPQNASIGMMLGELALAENNSVECSNRVTAVLRQDPANYDALLLQARLCRTQGDHDKSIEVLERAQGLYPTSPQLDFELGLAHVANGNPNEAIQRLEAALDLDPQYPEASLLLADLQVAQGDPASAVRTLRYLLGARPDIPRALLALANAYRAQSQLDDALSAADRYLQVVTNDASGALTKGLILRDQRKNSEARIAFDQARQLAPASEAVLYQLVELDLLDQRYDDALARVRSAVESAPNSPGATYLLARVYLAQNKVDEAEAALNRTLELGPNFSLAYSLLLEIYASREDHASALAKLDDFLKQRPGNAGALMTKGMIYDRLGDHRQAAAAYQAVLATNPNSVPALNNLAYLYSEHLPDLDQARSLAAKARNLAPQDPGVADTLGWIEYRRGAYASAIPLLEESASKLPDQAEVRYHLGMARYMTGQEEAAREALTRALELSTDFNGRTNAQQHLALLSIDSSQSPDTLIPALEQRVADRATDAVAWQRLANLYTQTGAIEKAKAAYEQVLRINPKSASAMAGLAELYAGPLKQPARALELAKQARTLAPTDARIAHTLGRIAYRTRDYPWATSLLSDAARNQPNNPEVQFDFGLALYTQGRVPESRQAVARALELDPAFAQADVARSFISLTAVHESPTDAIPLGAVARTTLERTPSDLPALMVNALALEQSLNQAQAHQTYDQILTLYPDFSPALKRSAILLINLGTDDSKASRMAGKARELFPRDAELAKAFGILNLRQGDARYAVQLLEESARQRTTDGEVMYHLALARFQMGLTEPGLAALEKAVALEPNAEFVPEARRLLDEKKVTSGNR